MRKNWLRRLENKHKLIPHVVVFLILSFLTIRIVLHPASDNSLLYFYGLTVITVLCFTFLVAFNRYKDPYVEAKNKKLASAYMPLVSCIVAVYNEEDAIENCVISMVSQTYNNKEVIIVNDCSTDSTANKLSELQKKYDIKVINLEKNVGKKAALAQAVLVAEGTIYAFTDSDSTWEKEAVDKVATIFRAFPSVGAVSGHTRVTNAESSIFTKVQDSWYEGQYSIRKAFESVFSSVSCVSGPLAVFRKEAVFNFMPAWQNDNFLGQPFKFATDRTLTAIVLGSKQIGPKLLKKYPDAKFQKHIYPIRKWRVVYTKSARASTIVPDTFKKVIKQQVRWKKSFIRNIFYTGKFYWRKPLPVSIVYYLHIVFVIAGPFIAFRHIIFLPLHGNVYSMILYLAGICFVGFMFGLALKLEEPTTHRWMLRPLMSVFSTLILSWLIFYSAATIKKMVWSRA